MRRTSARRPWLVRVLAGLTLASTLCLAVSLGSASATQPDPAATAESADETQATDTEATDTEATDAASEPSPEEDPSASPEPDASSATTDPEPDASTDDAAAAQQAREQAAAQQKAQDEAAERQAKAQVLAEKRAAQAARAAQRAQASWDGHGRPHKLIIVKQRSIDLVTNGRLTRQVPRSGGALTLSTLGGFVPGDWLRIADGSADLTAAIVLTPGQSLTLGGDVHAVRLAGGPTPADAASIYTGRGWLALRGVTVGSFDPATGLAVPAGPGRPFLAVARGGRFEAIDSAINDLGTMPTDPASRAGLALGETSTGLLVRTTLARNSIGLKLDRTDGVRLDGVTVSDSVADGLVLRGDRGTALTGITAIGNGGNGVLVTGPSSDRPITGISATGNKEFGIALLGQTNTRVNGIATANNTVGGVRVGWSTDVTISDLTCTDDPIGVYTHVGSAQITINQARISGPRRGLHIERTTRGLTVNASTIAGASIAGIAIGGNQITLNQVAVADSADAVRVERGAGDVTATGLTLTGGNDGIVALSATKNIVLRNLVTDGVQRTAIRTFSPGLHILDTRITGSATGITAAAATTIANTTIDDADQGIRARSRDPVEVDNATVSAFSVGINVAPGSPVHLAGSHIDALEAIRGTLNQDGTNDLSQPPLNGLGAIGVPLILLALILEQIGAFRQRGTGHRRRRMPPTFPIGTASSQASAIPQLSSR